MGMKRSLLIFYLVTIFFPSGLFPKTAKTRISSNGGYQQQQPSYENSENGKKSLLPLLALAPLALLPLILLATTFGTSTTTGIVGGTTGGVTIVRKRKRRDTYMVSEC